MSDTVPVCPACGTGSVHLTAPGGYAETTTKGRYRCSSCGARFDTPDERERVREDHTVNGLAKRLADADATEVGE